LKKITYFHKFSSFINIRAHILDHLTKQTYKLAFTLCYVLVFIDKAEIFLDHLAKQTCKSAFTLCYVLLFIDKAEIFLSWLKLLNLAMKLLNLTMMPILRPD